MGTRLAHDRAMKRRRQEPAKAMLRAVVAPEPFGSAALRAFHILEVVVAAEEPSALDDVARATGLSKPTAFPHSHAAGEFGHARCASPATVVTAWGIGCPSSRWA